MTPGDTRGQSCPDEPLDRVAGGLLLLLSEGGDTADALPAVLPPAEEEFLQGGDLVRLHVVVLPQLADREPGRLLFPEESEAAGLEESYHGYPDQGHPYEEPNEDVAPPRPGELHGAPSLRLPGLVLQAALEHLDEEGDEDDDHDGGRDELPADTEEQTWAGASHQLDVLTEPLEAVEVGDSDTLEESDDQEGDAATEVVVDGEDIITSVVGEHHRHQAEDQTYRTYGETVRAVSPDQS